MIHVEPIPGKARNSGLSVVKQVASVQSFQHEVRWLSLNHGPGVAKVVRVDRSQMTYSTMYEGSHTLATWGRDAAAAYPVFTMLLAVLAHLHTRNQVHGGLSLDHVVIGRRGPVLVSPSLPSATERHRVITDLSALGHMIADIARCWQFSNIVPAETALGADRWISVGHDIARCGPNQHTRIESLVDQLRPKRRRWRWYGSIQDRRADLWHRRSQHQECRPQPGDHLGGL